MTLRLRNTLSRSIEPVEPIDGQTVRMYTCGPTVYRYAHVGNLRSYLLADLIRRTLRYHGLSVLHVKNITDVGHLRDEHGEQERGRPAVHRAEYTGALLERPSAEHGTRPRRTTPPGERCLHREASVPITTAGGVR